MADLVERLAIPTPFPVGPTNCYLVRGDPPSIVDPGPLTEAARETLDRKLAEAGCPIERIGAIVLTHGHLDHFGQAARVKARSGARVSAHPSDARLVEGHPESTGKASARYMEYARRLGMPAELTGRLERHYHSLFPIAEPCAVEEKLAEGAPLDLGGVVFEVLHTPGHTRGSVSLWHAGTGTLLTGDTLLSDITPNAFFAGYASDAEMGPFHYLKSLERLARLPARLALPGHGRPFEDVAGTVARVVAHHHERKRQVLDVLTEGRTPYDLIGVLFPRLPLSEVWLGFAEVVGHIELLEREGAVRREETPSSVRFVRA